MLNKQVEMLSLYDYLGHAAGKKLGEQVAAYAKIRKANKITLWGTGKPKRELIYVDDVADACIFFLNKKTKESLINIGTGKDIKIEKYAKLIMKFLNIKINIHFDKTKPDGTPRKLLDTTIAKKYGWRPKISLKDGFFITYSDYLKKY